MSSIDAVIAQARRPGGFTERKRFSLARTQAIQKLRQFALADPSAYVLELIQSAIANGASWIQIQSHVDSVTIAYIGGGIPEAALGRLFDFLFASKDRADLGYLRELAIGVNALMIFEPSKIIIESGDGTLAGTTRMELHAGEDRLDVGRPDHALAGTFVRAEGLRSFHGRGRERALIEQHCLNAPVPILYNSEAIFGYSTQRIPGNIGLRKHVSFDEGDLYGTIGVGREGFSLLTHGVLIEEVTHELVPGEVCGGVVCFNGLRKTADHARVVRDEHYAELWLRLRPYVRALLGGHDGPDRLRAVVLGEVAPRSIKELRDWLRAAGRVVLGPIDADLDLLAHAELRAIAAALQARVLCARREDIATLRILGGSGCELHMPRIGVDDLEFYQQAPASPPARPWAVQPLEVAPVAVALLQPPEIAEALASVLGEAAELRMRVYTPVAAERPDLAEVVFLSCGRELARHAAPWIDAGHVLVVELPVVAPSQLREHLGEWLPPDSPALLAEACLRHAAPTLAEAAGRVLAGLVDPAAPLGPPERHRVLAALVRGAVLRLRRHRGPDDVLRPALGFSLVTPGPAGVDLLGLPLFISARGRPLCARDLAALLTAGGGWLLAVPADAAEPASGRDDVVLVEPAAAPLLRALLGDALRLPATSCPEGQLIAAHDADGRSYTAEQIEAALRAGRTLTVHPNFSPGFNPGLAPPDEPHEGPDELPETLWLASWAWLRLAGGGQLLPALDFHLGDAEAREHGDELAFIAAAPVPGGDVDGLVGVPLAEPAQPGVLVVDEHLGPVHHFRELGHDFGVVGLLRLRGAWSEARREAVTRAIAGAVGHVYDDLLARLPTLDPHGRSFARVAATTLAYAGRRLLLIADEHGQVRVPAVTSVADRVLALPLFPGRRGLPQTSWQLIRRFAASGGDPGAALAELDLPATPAVLRAWLAAHLSPARLAREPAAPPHARAAEGQLELGRDGRVHPVADPDPDAPLDEVTLATTLEYWLHHLRPDSARARRPWDQRSHVYIELEQGRRDDELADVAGDAARWSLTLRRDHWLPRWASKAGRRDREAIAWLLLACYARVNEVFDEVTNLHEGQFQRAVADALESGRLAIVVPRHD